MLVKKLDVALFTLLRKQAVKKYALYVLGTLVGAYFVVGCCYVPVHMQWAADNARLRNIEFKGAIEKRFPGAEVYVAGVEAIEVTVYRWRGKFDAPAQAEWRDWLTAWRAARGAGWPIRLTFEGGKEPATFDY